MGTIIEAGKHYAAKRVPCRSKSHGDQVGIESTERGKLSNLRDRLSVRACCGLLYVPSNTRTYTNRIRKIKRNRLNGIALRRIRFIRNIVTAPFFVEIPDK